MRDELMRLSETLKGCGHQIIVLDNLPNKWAWCVTKKKEIFLSSSLDFTTALDCIALALLQYYALPTERGL